MSYLCTDIWPNDQHIKKIHSYEHHKRRLVPILILAGKKDDMIPPIDNSFHLYELMTIVTLNNNKHVAGTSCIEMRDDHNQGIVVHSSSELKKQLVLFKDGNHNDTCAQPQYYNVISKFVRDHAR